MNTAFRKILVVVVASATGAGLSYLWLTRDMRSAHTIVPIQPHTTIDFSSGTPVIKDTAEEHAIIDQAAKEMTQAARDVVFRPQPIGARTPEPPPAPSPRN